MLPAEMKRALAQKKAKFYNIDAIEHRPAKVGMGGRINTIMQAAFFKLAQVIPYEDADGYMKAAAKKSYAKKGDAVVKKNWDAIDAAIGGLVEIPVPARVGQRHHRRRRRERARHRALRRGHQAHPGPATAISCPSPRSTPLASCPPAPPSTRSAASRSTCPEWIPENCIQCNQCSLVCPHACIRPICHRERHGGSRGLHHQAREPGPRRKGPVSGPHAGVPARTAPAAATAPRSARPRTRPWS